MIRFMPCRPFPLLLALLAGACGGPKRAPSPVAARGVETGRARPATSAVAASSALPSDAGVDAASTDDAAQALPASLRAALPATVRGRLFFKRDETLYVADLGENGASPPRVIANHVARFPELPRDAKELVLIRGEQGAFRVEAAALDGSNVRELAKNDATDVVANVTADGTVWVLSRWFAIDTMPFRVSLLRVPLAGGAPRPWRAPPWEGCRIYMRPSEDHRTEVFTVIDLSEEQRACKSAAQGIYVVAMGAAGAGARLHPKHEDAVFTAFSDGASLHDGRVFFDPGTVVYSAWSIARDGSGFRKEPERNPRRATWRFDVRSAASDPALVIVALPPNGGAPIPIVMGAESPSWLQ
jgi:hypothetical protein